MFPSESSHKTRHDSSENSSRKESSSRETSKSGDAEGSYSTICLTIFIFRGQPDMYYKRHILVYFTSPENPDFHETVHAQRDDNTSPWAVGQRHDRVDWTMSINYCSHVNAGAVRVWRGEEMMPVSIVAAAPVEGQEHDSNWNCQNFVLEGLQEIVNHGLQTQEWYEFVAGELTDHLFDGAVA